MKVEIGDKVVTGTGFGYYELVVSGRTANTLATKFLNGSTRDYRANPVGFRVYEKAKVDRLLQLDQQMEEMMAEQRELYKSLPKAE